MADNIINISLKSKSDPTVNITTVDSGTVTGSALIAPEIRFVATGGVGAVGATGADGTAVVGENGISQTNLATNSVGGDQILDDAVDTAQLKSNSVNSSVIQTNAVLSSHIATNAVTSDSIATNSVDATHIDDGVITNTLLEDETIESGKIKDSAIITSKIANNQIVTSKIADNTVTGAKIENNVNLDGTVVVNHLNLAGSSPALIEGPSSDSVNIKTHSLINFQNTSGVTVASLDQDGNLTISGTVDGIDIATDVAANTVKTGITSEQSNAIASNTAKETNTVTNLGALAGSDSLTITSSDGYDTSIPAATTGAWGAMTDSDKTDIATNTADILTKADSNNSALTGLAKVTTTDNVGFRVENTWNGGDAGLGFRTSYGTDVNYTMGIKGSDDKFYISHSSAIGTNDLLSLSSSGYLELLGTGRFLNTTSDNVTIRLDNTWNGGDNFINFRTSYSTPDKNVYLGIDDSGGTNDKGSFVISKIESGESPALSVNLDNDDVTIANKLTVTDLEITDDLTLGDDVNINATGVLYLAGANNGEYITSSAVNTISIVAVSKILLDADTDVDGNLDADTVSADTVTVGTLSSKADEPVTIKSDQSMNFTVDSDNDQSGLKFIFNNGGSGGVTEIASIDDSGNFKCDGKVSINSDRHTEAIEIAGYTTASDSFVQVSASGDTDDHRIGLKLKHNADTYGFTVQSQDGVDSLHGLNVLRHEDSSGGASALFIERDNGDIGIGNTTPTAKLDVTGDIKASGVVTAKQRHIINCGWDGNSYALSWLPFGYGGLGEAFMYSTNAGYLESGGIVAPCDGYVESVVIRCENAAGSTEVGVHIAPEGTEVPATTGIYAFISPAVDMAADDTGYKFSGFVNVSDITNSFSAGDVIMISIDPSSAPGDAVATAVLVLDWNNTL